MVGRQGGHGGGAAELTGAELTGAELTAAVRDGYEAAAGGWRDGPGRMYTRLAQLLVAAAPVPLAGRRVLDLGAGTGAAGQAARDAGAAQVVAADLAPAMLRQGGPALHPVAADAVALPFRADSFDLVLAAFCLNHLPDPAAGLAEARRVSGALAASVFAPGWTHPAKDAVDAALRPLGYREPPWHASWAGRGGDLAGGPERLAAQARAAGFRRLRVRTVRVPTGLVTPAQVASWRLGLAQFAPFLASLDAPGRAAARRAAERAVAGTGPLVVSMAVLTAG
ncbi:MAG TPA: class I SAM-dependent methyltransferase [Streptosporangiaceae bacterium]|nr:class I SAM-dependent methyltransferase [Streptosporangiaceae bacterium]